MGKPVDPRNSFEKTGDKDAVAVAVAAEEAVESGCSAAAAAAVVEGESLVMEPNVAQQIDEFAVEVACGQVVHLVEEEDRRNLRAEEDIVVHSFAG